MTELNPALAQLTRYDQFINWRSTPPGAQPYDPVTDQTIDAMDPANHLPYDKAAALADLNECGVGFVFTNNDPFFVVEAENSVDAAGNPIERGELRRTRSTCVSN